MILDFFVEKNEKVIDGDVRQSVASKWNLNFQQDVSI